MKKNNCPANVKRARPKPTIDDVDFENLNKRMTKWLAKHEVTQKWKIYKEAI